MGQLMIRKYKEGVKVRVICDDEQKQADATDIDSLNAAGIRVRSDHSPLRMHHKFAIIDSRTLVSGSLNWTTAGVKHNQENIVVSRSVPLAVAFQLEFERLWTVFASDGA